VLTCMIGLVDGVKVVGVVVVFIEVQVGGIVEREMEIGCVVVILEITRHCL